MFQLTVSYSTHEELLAAVMALGGETAAPTPLGATLDRVEANLGVTAKGKPGRKSAAEKKEATAAATTAGFAEVKAPATPAKTVADLKAAIGAASKGDITKITEFVASLGVEKISDLAAVQIQEIFNEGQIEAFFNKPAEIDPMS